MNNRIKNSCDKILPTEQQKEKMFNHILNKKKKRGFQRYWIFGTLSTIAVVFLFMTTFPSQPKEPTPGMSVMRTNMGIIEYEGICYEYIGNYNGKKLKRTGNQFMGGIVYQIKGQKDAIVIYENGEYQHYQKCRGE